MNILKKTCVGIASLVMCMSAQNGKEILQKTDDNTVVTSSSYDAIMIISLGGRIREKKFTGHAEGKERAYMEFTYPARDKGTRFLMIEDEIWMYLPSIEKATKIAGHMLRQSMMGSDFSYYDIVENEKLIESYDVELTGTDTIDGKECYVLELTARVPDVNYYKRKQWVDRELYITRKAELYAKSGKLMKEVTVSAFKKIGRYNFPTSIKMVNKLRQDTYTELLLDNIKLDTEIPDRIFTRAYLERK